MRTYRFKADSYADVSSLFLKLPNDELMNWRVAKAGDNTEVEIVLSLKSMTIEELQSNMKTAERDVKTPLGRCHVNMMAETVTVSNSQQLQQA